MSKCVHHKTTAPDVCAKACVMQLCALFTSGGEVEGGYAGLGCAHGRRGEEEGRVTLGPIGRARPLDEDRREPLLGLDLSQVAVEVGRAVIDM